MHVVSTLCALNECRSLPINEFEWNPREESDVARDQAQADSDTRLLEHRWVSLSPIDGAFERLRRGRYGLCEDCGNEISFVRLQVVPFASYCVDCQRERENKLGPEDYSFDEFPSSIAMESAVAGIRIITSRP